jgi:hypothetical protein
VIEDANPQNRRTFQTKNRIIRKEPELLRIKVLADSVKAISVSLSGCGMFWSTRKSAGAKGITLPYDQLHR